MSIDSSAKICSLDLDKNGDVASRIIKVPSITIKEIQDKASESEKFLNSTSLLGFADSDVTIKNNKTLLKQLIDVENQNPKFMSLLKNISRSKIRFDNDVFYHAIQNKGKHGLIVGGFVKTGIVQTSNFLSPKDLDALAPKVIEQTNTTLKKKSEKMNIAAIALTGKFFGDHCSIPLIYVGIEEQNDENAGGIYYKNTSFMMKHVNILDAFLKTFPKKEEIESMLFISGHDLNIPTTYKNLNLMLVALMELNKIIVEKDKINEKNEFSLFYHCDAKFITFLKTLYSLANEYYEVETEETLEINKELKKLSKEEQDREDATAKIQKKIKSMLSDSVSKRIADMDESSSWKKRFLNYKFHIIIVLLSSIVTVAYHLYNKKQKPENKHNKNQRRNCS
jgi:hypothetical protein